MIMVTGSICTTRAFISDRFDKVHYLDYDSLRGVFNSWLNLIVKSFGWAEKDSILFIREGGIGKK
jgi:hypothetical protein